VINQPHQAHRLQNGLKNDSITCLERINVSHQAAQGGIETTQSNVSLASIERKCLNVRLICLVPLHQSPVSSNQKYKSRLNQVYQVHQGEKESTGNGSI
jgi:hypothetical protein